MIRRGLGISSHRHQFKKSLSCWRGSNPAKYPENAEVMHFVIMGLYSYLSEPGFSGLVDFQDYKFGSPKFLFQFDVYFLDGTLMFQTLIREMPRSMRVWHAP